MAENNLFQFAQVIAELPVHSTQRRVSQVNGYVPVRKNACIVCSICFTCSKYYGADCTCQELQPRRGKNLPEGGLDSRAKKLHPEDHEDYEFSLTWIGENAHNIYKDQHDNVVGLRELSEVSLCKAHSSTLYRAKKRHERGKNQAPPSPADSTSRHFINPYHNNHNMTGGLASKVRELAYQSTPFRMQEPTPQFDSALSHSHSVKRKRTFKQPSPEPFTTSMSTPIYTGTATSTTGPGRHRSSYSHHYQQQHHFAPTPMNTTSHHSNNSNNNNNNSNNTSHIKQEQQYQFHPQQQQIVDNFSSQLPPLQTRGYSPNNNNMMYRSIDTPQPSPLIPQSPPASHVVETVSLKSMHQDEYYFRNLAITNTFTFRDLLAEIEIIGSPPPGKRVVISDNDRVIYPMDQPIQSVIRKPPMTHIELSLGLLDQPSINWGDFNNTEP